MMKTTKIVRENGCLVVFDLPIAIVRHITSFLHVKDLLVACLPFSLSSCAASSFRPLSINHGTADSSHQRLLNQMLPSPQYRARLASPLASLRQQHVSLAMTAMDLMILLEPGSFKGYQHQHHHNNRQHCHHYRPYQESHKGVERGKQQQRQQQQQQQQQQHHHHHHHHHQQRQLFYMQHEAQQEQPYQPDVPTTKAGKGGLLIVIEVSCLQDLSILLSDVLCQQKPFERIANQGLYPSLRRLRIHTTDVRHNVEMEWILAFLQHHTTGVLTELELCVDGMELPTLLTALQGGLCPGLRRLTLQMSGPVPFGHVLDVLAQPQSRLLGLEMVRLTIDPCESASVDALLSVNLWTSSDVLRQQATALILADILLPSFALLVVLPPAYVEAATTGVLRLFLDPILMMDKSVLLRVLTELVEERFEAVFIDVSEQAAAVASVLESSLLAAVAGVDEMSCLRGWHNLHQATKHLSILDPHRRFVEELGPYVIEGGKVVPLLLKLTCERSWDEAYLAVTCLDAIPLSAYEKRPVYEAFKKDTKAVQVFIDVGRSPVTFRMNEAFVSVMWKLLTVDESLARTYVDACGVQLVLMTLNWPTVRLYLQGRKHDGADFHLALLQELFVIDSNLFEKMNALLLSPSPADNDALPALSCTAFLSCNAHVYLHHHDAPVPRGSLLCRYIIMLAAIDDLLASTPTFITPIASRMLLRRRKKEKTMVGGGCCDGYLKELLSSEAAQQRCGELLGQGGPLVMVGRPNLYYHEMASVINILIRRLPQVKDALLQLKEAGGGDGGEGTSQYRHHVIAAFLFILAGTDLKCPSINRVAADFLHTFIFLAEEIYEYAILTCQEEPFVYISPCGKGSIPRLDLVIQAFANLIHWVNEQDWSLLVWSLLSTSSGASLVNLILDSLEGEEEQQQKKNASRHRDLSLDFFREKKKQRWIGERLLSRNKSLENFNRETKEYLTSPISKEQQQQRHPVAVVV